MVPCSSSVTSPSQLPDSCHFVFFNHPRPPSGQSAYGSSAATIRWDIYIMILRS